jgi:hypothetical protein
VYTLEGVDPEGSAVYYTISGDNFSVDRVTGKIRLREPLDRETVDMLDLVITIQDENYQHIIPFRRTIKGDLQIFLFYVRDFNLLCNSVSCGRER